MKQQPNNTLALDNRQTAEMVRLIAHVSSAVIDSAPFDQRINSILSCVATAFESDACVARELKRRKLPLLAASGIDIKVLPQTLGANVGIAKTILGSGRGLIIKNAPTDPITASLYAASPAGHFRFTHYAGAPMMVRAKPVGVLGIYRIKAEPEYTADDLMYLEIVANELAASIQNNRLYRQQLEQSEVLTREVRHRERAEKKLQTELKRAEQLVRSNQQLVVKLQSALDQVNEAYDTTLEAWCAALDLRDEETMGHTIRVTELAIQLAKRLNYPHADLANLRRGALLHDIGKMGIPDSILLKRGPLTEQEWKVMRKHPEMAHKLLSRAEFLNNACEIPLSHHERWDGTGYPKGMKETEIPWAARIFAVVDVWDALSSDRPYRDAWQHDAVVEHIREGRGTHFDPDIADVFLAMMNEVPEHSRT